MINTNYALAGNISDSYNDEGKEEEKEKCFAELVGL